MFHFGWAESTSAILVTETMWKLPFSIKYFKTFPSIFFWTDWTVQATSIGKFNLTFRSNNVPFALISAYLLFLFPWAADLLVEVQISKKAPRLPVTKSSFTSSMTTITSGDHSCSAVAASETPLPRAVSDSMQHWGAIWFTGWTWRVRANISVSVSQLVVESKKENSRSCPKFNSQHGKNYRRQLQT